MPADKQPSDHAALELPLVFHFSSALHNPTCGMVDVGFPPPGCQGHGVNVPMIKLPPILLATRNLETPLLVGHGFPARSP
jgi:hypothetical protein